MKIVATPMPEENSSESSSESSQSNIKSNLEKTEEDRKAQFQVHKDNIGDAGDTKFENKTNIVAVGATPEDIPSFREWAEKHLAAEEKEKGNSYPKNFENFKFVVFYLLFNFPQVTKTIPMRWVMVKFLKFVTKIMRLRTAEPNF